MTRPLYYLATPYTKFDQGLEQAFIEAAKAAAILLKRGLFVFSPITHSHPIAVHGAMDGKDHDVWMPLDIAVLDECDEMLVVMMPGWNESHGIGLEIAHARKMGKPITWLSWPMLTEREHEGR